MNNSDDSRKWILIGGGIVAVLVVGFLLFSVFGQGGATPTPAPTTGVLSQIVGPVWEWVGTTDSAGQTTTVGNPAQYTIQFQANNTYSGKADCNSMNGTYSVNGSALTINPGATTLVGCPAGSLADQYTTQLFAAASYVMQGTELTINLKADAGNMRFRQQGAPTNASVLIGPIWKWTQTQYTNGTNQVVPDPNQYTLQFNPDGSVQVQADCNNGSGVYTAGTNNSLTIQIAAMTRVACPPGSLSEAFVQQLNTTQSFFTGGADLVLNGQNNTAKMMFGSGTFPTAIPPVTIVTVTPASTAVPATATVTNTPPAVCPGPPVIQSFVAENPNIQRGQNTVLRWGPVSNATQVAIDQGIGGVAAPGSIIVAPATTTTYTMTATGCGGTAQAVLTVTVNQPTGVPPTAAPTQPPTPVPPTQPPPTAAPTQVPPTVEPTDVPPTTQPGADLLGLWKWTGTRLQDGSTVVPPDPNQYTITFNANNSANIQADCNQGTATWSVSGNQLVINVGAVTQVLCEDGSLSEQYLAWLGTASTYNVSGAVLTIDLSQDTGSMSFTK